MQLITQSKKAKIIQTVSKQITHLHTQGKFETQHYIKSTRQAHLLIVLIWVE